jgi:hypothetical protein
LLNECLILHFSILLNLRFLQQNPNSDLAASWSKNKPTWRKLWQPPIAKQKQKLFFYIFTFQFFRLPSGDILPPLFFRDVLKVREWYRKENIMAGSVTQWESARLMQVRPCIHHQRRKRPKKKSTVWVKKMARTDSNSLKLKWWLHID